MCTTPPAPRCPPPMCRAGASAGGTASRQQLQQYAKRMLEKLDAQLRPIVGEPQEVCGAAAGSVLVDSRAAFGGAVLIHSGPTPSFIAAEQIERLKDVPPPDFGSLRVRRCWGGRGAAPPPTMLSSLL